MFPRIAAEDEFIPIADAIAIGVRIGILAGFDKEMDFP